MTNGIITLTTDFGTGDPYVGMVKGVILSFFPGARIVDLTHHVPPQDIIAAAWTLRDAVPYFPAGTVHLAVVDPGVGSRRRGLALSSGGHLFVGPDNGIFSGFYPAEAVVVLSRPEMFLPHVSATFHARDVFAPVAGRLAAGAALKDLGDPVADPVTIALAEPVKSGQEVRGEVVQVDRFGNLITNIPERLIPPAARITVRIRDREIAGLYSSYSAIPAGSPGALFSSSNRLELALTNGSAAQFLEAKTGEPALVTIL